MSRGSVASVRAQPLQNHVTPHLSQPPPLPRFIYPCICGWRRCLTALSAPPHFHLLRVFRPVLPTLYLSDAPAITPLYPPQPPLPPIPPLSLVSNNSFLLPCPSPGWTRTLSDGPRLCVSLYSMSSSSSRSFSCFACAREQAGGVKEERDEHLDRRGESGGAGTRGVEEESMGKGFRERYKGQCPTVLIPATLLHFQPVPTLTVPRVARASVEINAAAGPPAAHADCAALLCDHASNAQVVVSLRDWQ